MSSRKKQPRFYLFYLQFPFVLYSCSAYSQSSSNYATNSPRSCLCSLFLSQPHLKSIFLTIVSLPISLYILLLIFYPADKNRPNPKKSNSILYYQWLLFIGRICIQTAAFRNLLHFTKQQIAILLFFPHRGRYLCFGPTIYRLNRFNFLFLSHYLTCV